MTTELIQGLRVAEIIQIAEENHINWESAEQIQKIRERERFFLDAECNVALDEATISACLGELGE